MGGSRSKVARRQLRFWIAGRAATSDMVPVRMRSWRIRPRSMSVKVMQECLGNRSVSDISTPISNTEAWPSQARSVVLSPGPEAE